MSLNDNVVTNAPDTISTETNTGRVKWFNNKSGYGFITLTDGPRSGADVFVHHSAIKVDSQQYKYLVQGEYVEFSLAPTKNDVHEFQAVEVCGIKGGKLMCETRRDYRISRVSQRPSQQDEEATEFRLPRSVRPLRNEVERVEVNPRARGSGPREDGEGWKVVKSRIVENEVPAKSFGGRGRGRPPRSTSDSKN